MSPRVVLAKTSKQKTFVSYTSRSYLRSSIASIKPFIVERLQLLCETKKTWQSWNETRQVENNMFDISRNTVDHALHLRYSPTE